MRIAEPALAFDRVVIDGGTPLDLVVGYGEIAVIDGCHRRYLDTLLELVGGCRAPGAGDVRLDGLATSCWQATELHQRLRVLKPLARRVNGAEFRLPASDADRQRLRIASVVTAIRSLPASTRCIVVDSLLDELPEPLRSEGIAALRAFVKVRRAAVLVCSQATNFSSGGTSRRIVQAHVLREPVAATPP